MFGMIGAFVAFLHRNAMAINKFATPCRPQKLVMESMYKAGLYPSPVGMGVGAKGCCLGA